MTTPTEPRPDSPGRRASRLAALIATDYPPGAITHVTDADGLSVTVSPATIADWEAWLERFHIPAGETTHRGSYSTAKGHHGLVRVALTGLGVPALYVADAAGGAL